MRNAAEPRKKRELVGDEGLDKERSDEEPPRGNPL